MGGSFVDGFCSCRRVALDVDVDGVLPVITPIAAIAVAVRSLFITGLYVYYRDTSSIMYTGVMAIMAAFIAYGRFALQG